MSSIETKTSVKRRPIFAHLLVCLDTERGNTHPLTERLIHLERELAEVAERFQTNGHEPGSRSNDTVAVTAQITLEGFGVLLRRAETTTLFGPTTVSSLDAWTLDLRVDGSRFNFNEQQGCGGGSALRYLEELFQTLPIRRVAFHTDYRGELPLYGVEENPAKARGIALQWVRDRLNEQAV